MNALKPCFHTSPESGFLQDCTQPAVNCQHAYAQSKCVCMPVTTCQYLSTGARCARGRPQHTAHATQQNADVQVPLVTCGKDNTVAEAMRMMVGGHVHRVYIVDVPGAECPTPLAVVTTADMIHFASEHLLASGDQMR